MKRTIISLITLLLAATTLLAQEVTINVQPVQPILPPQAGQYVDNPGKFFIVRLTNNTDELQQLHIGLQIEQRFPDNVLMVQSRYGHIPRVPITLAPNQVKTLNPVEMKTLFTHYALEDIYIKDGTYKDYKNGIYGLLPEGQYELFLTAYKWDPLLVSPVTLSDPKSGNTIFNVCYQAQPPRFLTPIPNVIADDPLSMYAVTRVNRNSAIFTWAAPTLNCNATMIGFQYNARIVKLSGLTPDEAIERNPVVYERNRLTTPQLTIPESYIRQMLNNQGESEIFALQVTATTTGHDVNSLNYTLIENEGKSSVYLFRLIDPSKVTLAGEEEEEEEEESEVTEEDDGYTLTLDSEDSNLYKNDSLYVFEQPMLTEPSFSKDKMSRKIYFGEDINAEWRKAWYVGGRGQGQDSVKFEYTVQLFIGNPADTPQGIFASKPIVEHKTTELKDTIKWNDFKEKTASGEYMILRIKAKATNEKSVRMLADSLNYIDFALTQHFDDDFACGNSTADVKNKELITKLPPKGTNLKINSWYLTLNEDCKLDDEKHTVSGTGWIAWNPMGTGTTMNCRVAVKFDSLKVNTDNIVFSGKCQTYPKSSVEEKGYSAEQVVDSIFSQAGLDNIWGSLSLPDEVKDKVAKTAKGEIYDVATAYNLGKYYGYLKEAQNKWENVKKGDVLDLYFPVELPDAIKSKLPSDFNVQIASMMFTPKSAVMNLIAMLALPNCDIIQDNDVLVFGCPRLCISPDRIFPEDGVLALLSNFKIQDPSSDFSLTFVAPSEPLNPMPNDGCFIRWENDEFGGLGLEIAATIPNTNRVVDGTVHEDLPALLDLRTTIYGNKSAGDFIAYGSMTPFQVKDLPDWTFSVGEEIIFDHNLSENGKGMPSLESLIERSDTTFNPKACGTHVEKSWDAWEGVYIKNVSVGFPKFAVFGSGEKGVSVGVEDMLIDGSGVTCYVSAKNILEAETGSCGGWKFSIDEAKVNIVQNNFNSCQIKGGFGIPLFGKKSNDTEGDGGKGKAEEKKGEETDVVYTCQIRHLTDTNTVQKYYTYDPEGNKVEHKRYTYGEKSRYAYIFKTEQVNDLYMNCFVADLTVLKDQTYFVVAAEEGLDGKTKTDVELRMAGDITLASDNSTVKALKEIADKLPIKVSMPGIHFAKLRLSNFKRADSKKSLVFKYAQDKMKEADKAEADWETSHTKLMTLANSKELTLSEKCYLDLGEWSLASVKKKLGPFSFELTDYKFGFSGEVLSLDIDGKIGFCGDKVTAGAGLAITSKLTMPSDKTDIGGYKLSNGKVEFKSVTLECDFASVLKLSGRLDVVKDSVDSNGTKLSGYAGKVDCEIKGLFTVNCKGGYFNVIETDETKLAEIKADNKEEGVEEYKDDKSYAFGYFMVEIKSGAGIRMDPLVINRIAGGFYFNCRPKWNDDKKEFENPTADYGCIGVSLGMGFTSSAGEKTLSANVDLNVIYKKDPGGGGKLTTFLFKGDVKAVSGMIDAKMTLLYQNDDTDRFLSLDITVTAGLENGTLGKWMEAANKELAAIQDQLNKFQEDLDDKVKDFVPDANGGLASALDDDGDHEKSGARSQNDTKDAKAKEKAENAEKSKGITVSLPFQLKITWKEKGVEKSPVRWHLYLGEPEKSKRCQIILLDFKSAIVNVNIGADAYLCIGNELPGNGRLPDIPKEITDFLNPSGVDTGADMGKAQRSRNNACKAMMGTDVRGGLMVGASAWGFIDIDLGLFYGGLKAIAGFDMALVNYGDAAYCINLKQAMGKNGWYATGQFYAYLAANFGLHIKLGKLIDRKISIVDAGIGGVFQAGLPSPTWVDGQARVKLQLLNGLVNINKSFHFECGDYCEAFVGNALDGFSLFGDCSIASDSLKSGWDEQNAILTRDASKCYITTEASLNSQYRLVDPSTQKALADDTGYEPEELKMQASRTYVFNFDKSNNYYNYHRVGVKGARLLEITQAGYDYLNTTYIASELGFSSKGKKTMASWITHMNNGWKSMETSIIMANKEVTSTKVEDEKDHAEYVKRLDELTALGEVKEIPISIRETQGTRYHLGFTLQPDCYYILILTGTAYEVEGGKCYWVEITEEKDGKMQTNRQQWIQHKFFYFRTKSNESVPAMPTDLKPYVALAYPAGDDLALFNSPEDQAMAYDGDLASPTIALNQDISEQAYKDGQLTWELRDRRAGSTDWDHTQTIANEFTYSNGEACINMGPKTPFGIYKHSFVSSKREMEYNLRLGYRYKTTTKCPPVLNANSTMEENWAVYRRFIKYWGYSKKFNTYLKEHGYTSATYDLDAVKTKLQCAQMVLRAKNWINSTSEETVRTRWNDFIENVMKDLDCQKDTTMYLVDLWFRGNDGKSWYYGTKSSFGAEYTRNYLLPYENAFVGVRPASEPRYTYDATYDRARSMHANYLDKTACFWGSDKRTDDPFLYFAYLSNWVFPSGVQLNAYDFDDLPIKHATETLTFSYNGVDVQGSALISGMEGNVLDLRDRMYKAWNDWSYNNGLQPEYPLPAGDGPLFELTRANQDGKTSQVVQAYDSNYSDYPYPHNLMYYIRDFAAPYYVASKLDDKMKEIADELYDYYYDNRKAYGKDGWLTSKANTYINADILDWNDLHRGQYLTIESRGFKVKVPYYQFPLIFGDCFGLDTKGDPLFDNKSIDREERSFHYSVASMMSSDRWKTEVSNLMFFRLRGGYPWAYYTDSKYSDNYTTKDGKRYIERDAFSTEAVDRCTSMPLLMYRVDSYNTNTGLYTYNGLGAAKVGYLSDYFTPKTIDPLNDADSRVKGSLWDWVHFVGAPKVECNDSEVEESFDKEEKK